MREPYKSKGRSWIKVWVNEWLDGTTRYEMTGSQRAFWVDLLAMAGRSRLAGVICAGAENGAIFGYPLSRFEGVLSDPSVDVLPTLHMFQSQGKIKLSVTRELEPTLYSVEILNWDKYQSEYMRQVKCRTNKRQGADKVTPKNTERCAIEGEGEKEVEEEGYKNKGAADAAFVLPDWIPSTLWMQYLEMRRRIRKPPTNKAKQLVIAKLERLKHEGNDVIAVLEQSIQNSWQGIFPVREEQNGKSASSRRTEANLRAIGINRPDKKEPRYMGRIVPAGH